MALFSRVRPGSTPQNRPQHAIRLKGLAATSLILALGLMLLKPFVVAPPQVRISVTETSICPGQRLGVQLTLIGAESTKPVLLELALPRPPHFFFIPGSLQCIDSDMGQALVQAYGGETRLRIENLRLGPQDTLILSLQVATPRSLSYLDQTLTLHASLLAQAHRHLPPLYESEKGFSLKLPDLLVRKRLVSGSVKAGSKAEFEVSITNPVSGIGFTEATRLLRFTEINGDPAALYDSMAWTLMSQGDRGKVSFRKNTFALWGLELLPGETQRITYAVQYSNQARAGQDSETILAVEGLPYRWIVKPDSLRVPIQICSWQAQGTRKQAHLSWYTLGAADKGEFTIEYSKEGRQFSTLGIGRRVNVEGKSQRFRFTSPPLEAGSYWFRLRYQAPGAAPFYSRCLNWIQGPHDTHSYELSWQSNTETAKLSLAVYRRQWVRVTLRNEADWPVQLLYEGIMYPQLPYSMELSYQHLTPGYYTLELKGKKFKERKTILLPPMDHTP